MAKFVEVMKKKKEMCDYYDNAKKHCEGCPLDYNSNGFKMFCSRLSIECPDEVEEIIMGWEKPVDWSKVEVDTPILVRNANNDNWVKRHFAKYENEYVHAWENGTTSWSAKKKDAYLCWEYAKLADEEGEQND